MRNTVFYGEALAVLRRFPANIVQTCVTSPPYWGLRDFGIRHWFDGDQACEHKRDPLHDVPRPAQAGQSDGRTSRRTQKPYTSIRTCLQELACLAAGVEDQVYHRNLVAECAM